MHSIDLWKRSIVWQRTSGGRAHFTAFWWYWHTHFHGHGSNGDGARRYNGCVSMFALSTIMPAYGHAALGHFMKALRWWVLSYILCTDSRRLVNWGFTGGRKIMGIICPYVWYDDLGDDMVWSGGCHTRPYAGVYWCISRWWWETPWLATQVNAKITDGYDIWWWWQLHGTVQPSQWQSPDQPSRPGTRPRLWFWVSSCNWTISRFWDVETKIALSPWQWSKTGEKLCVTDEDPVSFEKVCICPWWWSNEMWSMRECWVWLWSS